VTRRADWLLGQLPMGMLDDDFFVRFVSIFQEVATTLLEGADNIANIVDLTVAPPEVVRFLGTWLGISAIDASLPEQLQRRLVRQAGRSLAWRGTRRGLEGFLSALTGGPVEIDDTGAVVRARSDEAASEQRPRHVSVRVASLGWLSEADLLALVADEVPANVTFELFLGERQLWPSRAAGSGDRVP
jgi:phage tail-like protein